MSANAFKQSHWGAIRGLLFMRFKELSAMRSVIRSLILFGLSFGLLALLRFDDDAEQRFAGLIGAVFTLRFLPVFCLTKGGESLRSELKEGTIEYLWVRPASKTQLYLGLSLSGFVEILALVVPCVAGVSCAGLFWGYVDFSALLTWWFTFLLASAAYSAISTALAAVSSKFVVIGIFYFSFIELGLSSIPNVIRKLAVSYHANTLMGDGGSGLGVTGGFVNSCLWLIGICLVFLVLGAMVFSQSRYLAGSEKEA